MSEIIVSILFFVFTAAIITSFFWVKKELEKLKKSENRGESLGMIKQDLENIRKGFEAGYNKMSYELGKVQEMNRAMKEFQDFLRSPKLRGNIGEQVLRDLLVQVLPKKNFALQYQFHEGQKVDAIIKTNQGIIPIDSKFPMENFQKMKKAKNKEEKKNFKRAFLRDIKKHIKDISQKYILPQEGTVDFAVMYVPSEAVYYEVALKQPSITEISQQRRVYLTSPNSFYYFLKTIMLGLEGAKIEESAKEILRGMKSVKQEALKFEGDFSVLTSHIERAKNCSERARTEFERLKTKIENLGQIKSPEENKKIEK